MPDDTTHPHGQPGELETTAGAHCETWDAFYDRNGQGAPVWSGQPNGSLVAEVADLEPGTALDVGCGEGADAIWLAHQGWKVTALDPSAVALKRAAAATAEAKATITWLHGGLIETARMLGTFDLVSVHYSVLPLEDHATAIRLLCHAVAPGGTLLVVHHELDLAHDAHAGPGRDDHLKPDDVAAQLGDEWHIKTHHRRARPAAPPPDTPDIRDIVLRAHRLEGPTSV
jgi:SAM-dependent methyltransferase